MTWAQLIETPRHSNDCCLYKRKETQRCRITQGRPCDHGSTFEGDTATSLGRPRIARSHKKVGVEKKDFPHILQMSLPTFWFWTSCLQNFERIPLCCLKPSCFVALCYVSPRKLIHHVNKEIYKYDLAILLTPLKIYIHVDLKKQTSVSIFFLWEKFV